MKEPSKQSMNTRTLYCGLCRPTLFGFVAALILNTSTYRFQETALWTMSERFLLTIFLLQILRITTVFLIS